MFAHDAFLRVALVPALLFAPRVSMAHRGDFQTWPASFTNAEVVSAGDQ
jgi:hypothetical protein